MGIQIVDELLVKLGVDPTKWKSGLAEASRASSSFISGLKEHQTALAGITVTSGLTLASQIAFIKDVTNEYAKQEEAENKLQSNLKAEQRTREDSVAILVKQADALQKITPFADEQIISMQGTAAAFGLTDDQIQQLTPHLLDAAAGFRDVEGNALDLDTVAKAVGKAFDGNSASLKKLGIDVKLTGDQSKDFALIMDTLAKKFDGAAESAGTTFAGKMKIAAHEISEVKEQIGSALAPVLVDLANKIVPIVTKFGEWAAAHKDVVLAIVGGGVAGAGLLSALSAIGLVLATLGGAAGPIALVVVGLAALVGWIIKLRLETFDIPKGIDAITESLRKQNEELQRSIDRRKELESTKGAFEAAAIGALKAATGGDHAGIAGVFGDVDKHIETTQAHVNALKDALAQTPKLELETRLSETVTEAEKLDAQIHGIETGEVKIKFVGELDALIKRANDAKLLIGDLREAIAKQDISKAPSVAGALPETGTGATTDIKSTIEYQVAFDKKSTQEWLSAKLALIEKEKEEELAKAEKAGKDATAIEVKYLLQQKAAHKEYEDAVLKLHMDRLDAEKIDRKNQTTGGELDFSNVEARFEPVKVPIQFEIDERSVEDSYDTYKSFNEDLTEEARDRAQAIQEIDEQMGQQAALAATDVIASMGDMFGQFLAINGKVADAIAKTLVVGAIEALKAVVRAVMEAEIAKATITSILSFGATLAAVAPIAAAGAAGIGILSAIENSFKSKNTGKGYELGGIVQETGWALMHEKEIVHNPRTNSSRDLARNFASAGATDTLKEAAGVGARNGSGDVNGSFRIFGNINKQVDLNEAMKYFASLLAPALG